MNPKLIVIDGKSYKGVNEMPPDVRQKYEQALRSLGNTNGNHIPDVLENIGTDNIVVNSMKVVIDGREFDGLENLPPEARARYEQALGKLDANRNGIPDFAEAMVATTNQSADVSASVGMETPRRSTPLPSSPTTSPDTTSGWMLALVGLLAASLCVAGAVGIWYFFLR